MIKDLLRKLYLPGDHAVHFNVLEFVHRVDMLRDLEKRRKEKLNKSLESAIEAQERQIDFMLKILDNSRL